MFRPANVSLQCPQCSFSYQAPVFSIIDIGQTPELKQVLLAGQLNASQCPNCRNVNYLATPVLYHDPENEFLGIFMPQQLNMAESQRQKALGDLTKALMDALPAEQRRGYMLTPQQFLSMEGLTEKILGFDGITPDMIAANRKKVNLTQELAVLSDDDIAFNIAVKENEELLDDEFFMLISSYINTSESQGQTEQAELLADLREKLLPLTAAGQKIQRQRQAVARLGTSPSQDEVLQAVLDADSDELDAIAVAIAPVIDYQFFEVLTARIESLSGEERVQMEQKRERLVEVQQNLRQAEEERLGAAAEILQKLLSAEDIENAVDEMLPYLDRTVLSVLMLNISNAEEKGATAAVARLRSLYDLIVSKMQGAMPPELLLLLKLAEADYPHETRALLRENKEIVNQEFLDMLQANIEQMEAEEGEDEGRELAMRHFRNILTQARLGA